MKPAQLTACIHAALTEGFEEAEERAARLCSRFGGETVPTRDAFDKGMEELRGVERTARELQRRRCDGQ